MALGLTFLIIAAVVVFIWILVEAKRMKHKIFAIFLILLILFSYVSFIAVIKNNDDVDLKSAGGIMDAGKIYFVWLGGVFQNLKSITAYAFKQDWKVSNKTVDQVENPAKNKTTLWDKIKS